MRKITAGEELIIVACPALAPLAVIYSIICGIALMFEDRNGLKKEKAK